MQLVIDPEVLSGNDITKLEPGLSMKIKVLKQQSPFFMYGSVLLLKISHFFFGHRIWMGPNLKASSTKTTFYSTRRYHDSCQKKELFNVRSMNQTTISIARCSLRYNNGSHIGAVTSSSIMGLSSTQHEGNHVWYWKPKQLPYTGEVIDLRGDRTTVTVQDQHNS